ncbi:hypothetical protein AMECASPLE_002044 [Ameca splendens]|uniref:Uncharacterized protein n=1 Tax=Ameca splendens TaxID=208324 RepID=A0ABV0ZU27_9TELE
MGQDADLNHISALTYLKLDPLKKRKGDFFYRNRAQNSASPIIAKELQIVWWVFHKMDREIEVSSAVVRALLCSVLVRKRLSLKRKFLKLSASTMFQLPFLVMRYGS